MNRIQTHPVLAQFRSELKNRYESVKTYAFEKGIHEIDRDVRNGDMNAAKNQIRFIKYIIRKRR